MGQSPQGETCNVNGEGVPLLNGPTEFGIKSPTPIQFTTDQKKKCQVGDVLFCVRGSTTGRMNWADKVYAIGRGLAAIRHKEGSAYQHFIKGLLDYHLPTMLLSATGSTFPNVSGHDLNDLEIDLPPLPEQKSIASVLSSLDDKIDLLHRQNKTLEALAETLFRQWFIETVPQPSPNLSQGERDKEEAEEGWEVVKVKDVCKTITKGTTPTTLGNNFVETGVNFLKAESLTDEGDLLENKFAHIDEATHEKLSRSKLEVNDLIITIAGTIGRVAIVPERVLPANTNQALAILRLAKNTISHIFLYCLFKSTEVRNDFESRVVHAVQPNLSLGEIGDISFKLPPKGKLEFGEKELELIFQKKEKNNIQIRTLTRLRDTLLPKLMSGEVRVKDMEKTKYKL